MVLAQASRRAAILDVAIGIVVERGFEGLRLRDVAAAAGINSATLVYYYPGKEELIVALVREIIARFRAINEERGVDLDSPGGLALHLGGIRESVVAAPDLYVVLCEVAVRAPRHPKIAAVLDEAVASWTWVFRRLFASARPGASAAEIGRLSAAAIALFWGLSLRANADGSLAALRAGGEASTRAMERVRTAADAYAALLGVPAAP